MLRLRYDIFGPFFKEIWLPLTKFRSLVLDVSGGLDSYCGFFLSVSIFFIKSIGSDQSVLV